ncbi:ABC transporter permease [Halomarina salina]|uniref:ABC transporter permease n=1 Tax=Halomarina salina TaxID=1872699 RepID=A0ABD5RJD3_9EURY|nr:ABC transporter permease [Halomarina salina]
MQLGESFSMSMSAIRAHKLRSGLTVLGVVIGVAAVITFVTLGGSLQVGLLGDIGGEGAANVNVWSGPADAEGPPGAGAQPVFTSHDVRELGSLDGVREVVPRGSVPLAAVRDGDDTVALQQATAYGREYFTAEDFREGRTFRQGTNEVVLNPAAASLFEEDLSAGDAVTLTLADGTEVDVRVAGVLDTSTAQDPFEGFSQGPRVYVPTDPFYQRVITSPATGDPERVYPAVFVIADGPEDVEEVQARTLAYLTDESDAATLVPPNVEFVAQTNEQLLDQVREILDTLTAFVTGVAVISLVVGAIGIANIMLVSVTERTREIGIMKAVGARDRDVLGLFLTEAVVLGLVGALVGTVVGLLAGYAGTVYVDLPFVVPWEWGVVAVAVGLLVGVGAGLYPAWNAARTDPIDALRYE